MVGFKCLVGSQRCERTDFGRIDEDTRNREGRFCAKHRDSNAIGNDGSLDEKSPAVVRGKFLSVTISSARRAFRRRRGKVSAINRNILSNDSVRKQKKKQTRDRRAARGSRGQTPRRRFNLRFAARLAPGTVENLDSLFFTVPLSFFCSGGLAGPFRGNWKLPNLIMAASTNRENSRTKSEPSASRRCITNSIVLLYWLFLDGRVFLSSVANFSLRVSISREIRNASRRADSSGGF